MTDATHSVRLTPELQAEYQQTFNDPRKKGSPEWYVAAKGLFAAGLIQADPDHEADMEETQRIADSQTDQQSL